MIETASESKLLFAGQNFASPLSIPFLSGEAIFYTHASIVPRYENQDSIGIFSWRESIGALVVADGLGGLPNGGDVSKQVINAFCYITAPFTEDLVISPIESVNRSLVRGKKGGGSTVCVIVVDKKHVRSYHVGDAAAMVVAWDGKIKFHTISHSSVGISEANGSVNEEQAMVHRDRHVINNMVGMPDMWIDISEPLGLGNFDTVILASDGLWDNCYRHEVANFMRNQSLMEVAHEIVQACTVRMEKKLGQVFGKPDDLSFILYRS